MENIIELEVINKNVKVKYRKPTNIIQKYKYHFSFSENWNELDKRIIFYIKTEKENQIFFSEYNGEIITPNSDIFTSKFEGESLYIGVCGIKDNYIYPSSYCYIGKISLNS